jgi:CRISPR-associated protein (TIGR02584 family)
VSMPEHKQPILLAVLGTSPAILTEAFYFYARRSPQRTVFTEIHALATKKARDLCIAALLEGKRGKQGQFDRLLQCLRIPRSKVTFNENTLYLLHGQEGQPLDDVRDSRDSTAIADQICAKVRELCSRKGTALYATIAGGRKTMGVYLAMALQLYARPQDRLFHVLIDPRIEKAGALNFFFPDRPLRLGGGKTIRPEDVRIDCEEIPFLYYPREADGESQTLSFRELYERRQRELNWLYDPPPLMIDVKRRVASIGGYDIKLDPLEFFYYYFFVELRKKGKSASFPLRSFVDFWHTVRDTYPAVPNQESTAREVHLLRRLEHILQVVLPVEQGREVGFRQRLDHDFAAAGDYTFIVNSTFSKIRNKIRKVVPPPLVDTYAIRKSDEYGKADYAIQLSPEKIEILSPIV